MDPRYSQWIRNNVKDDPTGTCVEATLEMQAAFPELRRVRGHYFCSGREYTHWWLKTESGRVVDPTSAQFKHLGLGAYVEHEEGSEEPIGRCANCGGYIYASSGYTNTVCSDTCATDYAGYLTTGRL